MIQKLAIRYMMVFASLLLLVGCVSGITYDNGAGGVINFAKGNEIEVLKMANEYCRKNRFNGAVVNQVHYGIEKNEYEFKCLTT